MPAFVGRYELVRSLGEGGQGTVHEAILHGPGGFTRTVALKVVRGGTPLASEARLGALLRHPHLVDVYEVGVHDDAWFLAMELCADGSLAGRPPLPPRAVVEVGLQVCDALRYADAELGLVHLDLKPHNLLLDGPIVKVADLGIAYTPAAGRRRVLGTPGYAAPEVARAAPVDARADVYSLGIVLLQLATGRATLRSTLSIDDPEATSDTISLDALDARDETPGPAPERERVAWLEPVLERCLADQPDHRFASMAELADALRGLDATGPSLSEFLGLPERAPARRPTLCGRQDELDHLEERLGRPGVVTLVGPPGIGKTALARELVRRKDGRFCDLTDARSLDGLASAVARGLGVPLGRGDGEALVGQLGHVLAAGDDRPIVLDNFEQVVVHADVVARWAARAPRTPFLVTSRQALGLRGEEVVPVGVLSAEDGAALVRARARERGVELGEDPLVAELVRRLDGVPLALELAAGRLGVLSLAEVLDHLSLSLLRSGEAGRADRERTLRDAVQWSYELLDEPARRALARLSVFRGGFGLDAADAVLGKERGQDPRELVRGLVDRSLVLRRGSRFHVLEPVRSFADTVLPEQRALAEAAHTAFFAAYVALDEGRSLAPDLENVVVACRRAVAAGDLERATDALSAAWKVLLLEGPYGFACTLAAEVVAATAAGSSARSDACVVAANALRRAGRTEQARACAEEAASIRARLGRRGHARALAELGVTELELGRGETARAHLEQALEILQDVGDRRTEGVVHGTLANLHQDRGRLELAREHYERALALHRETGNRRWEGGVLGNLGNLHRLQGEPDLAHEHYEQALAIHRESRDRPAEASVLGNLGNLHRERGRRDEALACYEAALALQRGSGDRRGEGMTVGHLGALHLADGRTGLAREHYERALALHREVGNRRFEGIVLALLGSLHAAAGDADAARERLEQALAVQAEAGDRLAEAYALGRLAVLDATAARWSDAAARLDRGEALVRSAGVPAELARLLVCRAEVARLSGALSAATAALDEAADLAAGRADLQADIARLRSLLAGDRHGAPAQ